MSVILIVTCVTIPINLAFDLETGSQGWRVYGNIVDILFTVDIFACFNTGFEDALEEVVTDRKEIAKRYLKGWFTIDVVAVLPF